MKSLKVHILALIASIILLLQACGTSQTNGSLTVADLTMKDQTGGYYSAETTVTYTPPTDKDPNGTKVTVSTQFTTYSGASSVAINKTLSITKTLDSTGAFDYTYPYLIAQGGSPIFVTITASTGDLVSSKIGSVPAIAALSATPSSIAFASTATAGTTQTVTLSGGYTPYQAPVVTSSAGAGISNITASISGTTMTVVLVAPGDGTKSAKITVFDVKGNSVVVGVTY